MNPRSIRCPRCGETGTLHRLCSTLYSPAALVAIGGPTLALVFDLSRKQQFGCDHCGATFSRHSFRSRVFQAFWIWFFISFGAVLFVIASGLIWR